MQTINKQASKHRQLTLKQCRSELHGPTYMQMLFNSKYYRTTRSVVGWSHRFRGRNTNYTQINPHDVKGSTVITKYECQEGNAQVTVAQNNRRGQKINWSRKLF